MNLTLVVDHACNLRCGYCYAGEKRSCPMPLEVAKRAIDFALPRASGHLDLSFFGGEPLLHLDFLRTVVSYAQQAIARLESAKCELRVIVSTNGTLIDDAALDWLASVPSPGAAISLDGTQEAHDLHRRDAHGRGSYARALAGLHALLARKIETQIVSVFRPDTARQLGRGLSEMIDLGAEPIAFTPDLSAPWDAQGYEAYRAGLEEAAQVWADTLRAGRTVWVDPLVGKILTHVFGGIPCPSRCRLGGAELVVAPSGRIYPCGPLVREDRDHRFVIGDVERGLDLDRIRALQTVKDRVEETCRPCELRDRCQSHCGCRHVALTGEFGHITDTLCETESIAIEVADRIAEQLWSEQNPAFIELVYGRNWAPAMDSELTPLRRARDATVKG